MKTIIIFILGAWLGFFVRGLCSAAKGPSRAHYVLVHIAYRMLVDARDTGDVEEIAIAAEEAIGYLGQALE